MAKGVLKIRKLAFFKDGKGFISGFGSYTMNASEVKIFKTYSEIRKARKAFEAWKEEGLTVVEFPEIKERTRQTKTKV